MSTLSKEILKSSTGLTAFEELVRDIDVNDENWRCVVTMLVETSKSQEKYTSILTESCAEGSRKVIYHISKETILATAQSIIIGNSTSAVSPSRSLQRVRQCAQSTIQSVANSLESKTLLDHLVEATLIKWLIYEARLESIWRSSAESEAATARDREILTLPEVSMRDQKKSKSGKIATTESRIGSARRANSRLRKRGEEWRDRIYIDDAPSDGPNMYILLTGFHNPKLPRNLINIGVPLSCILRLENFRACESISEDKTFSAEPSTTFLTAHRLESVPESQNNLQNFWNYFNSEELCDVAVRSFCPTFHADSDPSDLYDGISYTLYDVHDMLQAHAEYLASMRVIQVEHVPPDKGEQHTGVYKAIINHVLEEAMTVPELLEAMLRQIEDDFKKGDDRMYLSTRGAAKTAAASSPQHSRNSDRYLREQTHGTNDVYDEEPRLFSSFSFVASTTFPRQEPSTLPEAAAAATTTATSLSKVNSAAFARLTEKLRLLNLKYELISRANDSSLRSPSPEPELILHGDSLRLNACRANDEKEHRGAASTTPKAATRSEEPGWKLPSFQVSLPQEEPRIAEAWRKTRAGLVEMEHCTMHLPRIFHCSKKQGIDESRAKHLLNLLGFKSMLESHYSSCVKSEISLSKREAKEKLSAIPRNRSKVNQPKIETDSLETTNRPSDEGFGARKNGAHVMDRITNDRVTNLPENNSRSPETRGSWEIANHVLDDFNSEASRDPELQQRNIVFNDFSEFIYETECEKTPSLARASQNRVFGSLGCRCPASTMIGPVTGTFETKQRPHEKPQSIGSSSDQQQQLENTSEVPPRVSSLNSSPSMKDISGACYPSRILRSFERYSGLFGLIDASVVALDGQLQCPIALEEFEDAELLAPSAFLQIVRDCFQGYADGDLVAQARHFTPTDSILLLFGDESRCPGETIIRDVTCVLRTPVCLSDFCEFVLEEESDWLEKRRQRRSETSRLNERCRKQILGEGDEETRAIFRDEDFLLPGSLKACVLYELREQLDSSNAEAESEKTMGKNEDVKRDQAKKSLPYPAKPSSNKKKNARTTASSVSSSLSSSELKIKLGVRRSDRASRLRRLSASYSDSSSRVSKAPTSAFDFIGYDLGEESRRRRVQVSNLCRSWVSRADGTRLRLARESWHLGVGKMPSTTSISVTIPERRGGWDLKYHEVAGEEARGLFHVLTSSGITVAFSRLLRAAPKPNELLYEIQISWPSGLIIKPMEHQAVDHPFYILQYYTSMGPKRENIKDEKYRKYLHNGDVVKFFYDGSIIVLRPNGTVITVVNFEEADSDWPSESEMSDESLPEMISRRTAHVICESSSETVCPTPLRYIALELHGRRYEVLEGRGHRELDRLRASVAEEYSPEEKFARRADGTDALFNADAELIVCFPDGTRIRSSCSFEDKLVHCDWSPNELALYFGADKQPDGFVSVLVSSRVEHPNYATVSHDSGNLCCLSMCGGLQMELEPRGICRFTCNEDRVRVDLTEKVVSVIRNSSCDCDDDNSTSKTTFHLIGDSSMTNPPSSEDRDQRLLMTFCDNATYLSVIRDDVAFQISPTSTNTEVCGCGKKKNDAARSSYRLFAVNRKGEACEYHHRSVWRQYEEKLMSEHEEASLIQRPIQGRSEMGYRLGLVPLGVEKNWTLDYQIPKAKPLLKHRLVHGSTNNSDDYDEPLMASVSSVLGQRRARFLIARLFEGIGHHGENSLISMQKALLSYWQELATGMPNLSDGGEDRNGALPDCDCQEDTDDQLMKKIATGKVTTIPAELYESGRQHLREAKEQREAERTCQMIDRCYQRNATLDECPWLG
ncbi:hypothetical protein TSAR_015078 [Trichomalopsis sarcophagae]|uniref:Uncharacterized protein n=1 Tax=Trichomalopsis sarcophagae TaxID=543379 RepID=A0A232EQD0_9HYME|nr:hypothetical protein TSAR_015078 [Trichomalopsis sarcophagae]